MILKIAWRNIWRNRLRSAVVIGAIIVGVWAGIFVISLSMGISESRTKSQLENFTSHIQVHNKEFRVDQKIAYTLENEDEIENTLKSDPQITAFSRRFIVAEAMLESTKGISNLSLVGVDPEMEKKVTTMSEKVIEGSYFGPIKGTPILVSKRVADKYELEPESTMLIKFTNVHGDQVAKKFRVCGIYETVNMQHDLSTVYVLNTDLFALLNMDKPAYHEIAMLTKDRRDALAISKSLEKKIKSPNVVEYWGKISPDLGYAEEMMGTSLTIVMSIFMIGLLFGIINTMLMAVLERTRELGMLMSIGMNRYRIFLMIMFETLFLALVGGPIGIVLAYLTVAYFGQAGIDLSIVGEGMSSFGADSIMYPMIDPSYYPQIAIMVIITALIAAIFPARKALKLKPAEAVRAL